LIDDGTFTSHGRLLEMISFSGISPDQPFPTSLVDNFSLEKDIGYYRFSRYTQQDRHVYAACRLRAGTIECNRMRQGYVLSAVYLAKDVGKPAYDLLPKIEWRLKGDGVGLMPMNVTTDLESDLIEGLLSCDLEQINATPNQYGRYLVKFFRMPVRMLRCGLAGQLKQAGSGLSSVLLIAWQ
jgi:hypothetical protein